MNILHFCSYYVGSKVYFELFSALSKTCKQQVYVPVRSKKQCSTKQVTGVSFYFIKNLSIFTRIFYLFKLTSIIIPAFKQYSKDSSINIVHAHTLYADGIPAFIYSMLAKKKLVITIRNTDVNFGFKYYWQYKWLARKSLKYADKIIFISPAHQRLFESYFGEGYSRKCLVIPNGVNDKFIDNALNRSKNTNMYHAVYVGGINKNKNIESSIKAFSIVNNNIDWRFTVIGGSYQEYVKTYSELPTTLKGKVVFIPKVNQLELLEYYDESSIFIMPSFKETFGLVYIEAISRCLPVVYSYGQGIDGVFKEGVCGFGCFTNSLESLTKAIELVQNKFPTGLGPYDRNPASEFCWSKLAEQYLQKVYR